jgi:hypothetical protein
MPQRLAPVSGAQTLDEGPMTTQTTLLPQDMAAALERHIIRIPTHCREGFLAYLQYGQRPGSFLLAVLSNDLAEACARADDDNRPALYDYVFLLTNYAPSDAWGSPSRVSDWIERGRELAARRLADAITGVGGAP